MAAPTSLISEHDQNDRSADLARKFAHASKPVSSLHRPKSEEMLSDRDRAKVCKNAKSTNRNPG